jgi:hypothetical protein
MLPKARNDGTCTAQCAVQVVLQTFAPHVFHVGTHDIIATRPCGGL